MPNPFSFRAHYNLAAALREENLDYLEHDRHLRDRIQIHLSRAVELDENATDPLLKKITFACRYGDPIDQEWSDTLIVRWKSSKPNRANRFVMNLFSISAINKRLCLDDKVIDNHFNAYLDNFVNLPDDRAQVLIYYGQYKWHAKHDKASALSLGQRAYALSPSLTVKQLYAQLLYSVGETEASQQLLNSIPLRQRDI